MYSCTAHVQQFCRWLSATSSTVSPAEANRKGEMQEPRILNSVMTVYLKPTLNPQTLSLKAKRLPYIPNPAACTFDPETRSSPKPQVRNSAVQSPGIRRSGFRV